MRLEKPGWRQFSTLLTEAEGIESKDYWGGCGARVEMLSDPIEWRRSMTGGTVARSSSFNLPSRHFGETPWVPRPTLV